MEMAVFPIWKKASVANKKKIVERLAKRQAEMIIEEIEIQCQCPSKN